MNQKNLLQSIRTLQQQLKDFKEGYELGLYSESWYNEHIKGLKAVIEAKKTLLNSVYNIHSNI